MLQFRPPKYRLKVMVIWNILLLRLINNKSKFMDFKFIANTYIIYQILNLVMVRVEFSDELAAVGALVILRRAVWNRKLGLILYTQQFNNAMPRESSQGVCIATHYTCFPGALPCAISANIKKHNCIILIHINSRRKN